ncbi:hypothetical protein ACWCQL_20085 [Streptomyces sp. NPDC002073]|uniref:hypothetical protein n=1 Tax=Streptomyces sp. NBC_00239 TaxID=2903640 RepID=UPI002E2C6D4A|nr:hypothetical protein [Streptomyces sp. NBC_00239]
MSTPVHTRTLVGHRAQGSPADTRLPWWALALPVAAFAALLLLLAGSGGAEVAGASPMAELVDRIHRLGG